MAKKKSAVDKTLDALYEKMLATYEEDDEEKHDLWTQRKEDGRNIVTGQPINSSKGSQNTLQSPSAVSRGASAVGNIYKAPKRKYTTGGTVHGNTKGRSFAKDQTTKPKTSGTRGIGSATQEAFERGLSSRSLKENVGQRSSLNNKESRIKESDLNDFSRNRSHNQAKILDKKQAYVQTQRYENDLKKQRAEYDRLREEHPTSEWLKEEGWGALTGFNSTLASTADWLLPDVITPKAVQNALDYYKKEDEKQQKIVEEVRGGDPLRTIGGNLGVNIVQNVPAMLLAPLATGETIVTTAGTLLNPETLSQTGNAITRALYSVARETGNNPMFWETFLRTAGPTYDKEIENGADPVRATLSALSNGLLNAQIEIGGGIEKFDPTETFWKALRRSGEEEGLEEIQQYAVEGLTNKALGSNTAKWFSTKRGEDAVINPIDMAEQGAYGALAGGLMGGGRAGVATLSRSLADAEYNRAFPDSKAHTQDLVEQALMQAREGQKSSEAEILATNIQNMMEQGEEVPTVLVRQLHNEVLRAQAENERDFSERKNEGYQQAVSEGRANTVETQDTEEESRVFRSVAGEKAQSYYETAMDKMGENASERSARAISKLMVGVHTNQDIDTILIDKNARNAVEEMTGIDLPIKNTDAREILETRGLANMVANRDNMLQETHNVIRSNMRGREGAVFEKNYDNAVKTIGVANAPEIYESVFSRFKNAGMVRGSDFDSAYDRIVSPLTKDFGEELGGRISLVFNRDFAHQAFDAGRQAYIADEAKTSAREKAVSAERAGTVTYKHDTESRLSTRQKKFMTEFAKRAKLGIEFYDGTQEGEDDSANGYYENGVIHININSTNKLITVAKHELTHHIKVTAPEMYRKLEDFVIKKWYNNDPDAFDERVLEYQRKWNCSVEVAYEEIIANASEAFFTDRGTIDDAIKFSKKLGHTIHDGIRTLLDTFLDIQDTDRLGDRGYGEFLKELNILKDAQRMWLEALNESVERGKNNTAEATEADTEVRRSLKDIGMTLKDGNARWTDERIDRLIDEFGASNPDYSQAYAVLMNPRDFLKLTLADEKLDEWNEASSSDNPAYSNYFRKLNTEDLKNEKQTPFLTIYSKDGTMVQGHEGRHRMRALLEAGVKSVPVVIRDTDTKYTKKPMGSMTLSAQDFGYDPVNNNAKVTIKDLVPIKESNRAELVEKFGGEAEVRFSKKDDQDYLDAVNRGDMETAQRMVDEEAKKHGYTVEGYHGTQSFGFTKPNAKKGKFSQTFFVTDSIDQAVTYSDSFNRDTNEATTTEIQNAKDSGGKGNYHLFVNTEGLLEVDAKNNRFHSVPFNMGNYTDKWGVTGGKGKYDTDEIARYALSNGYKGVWFKNLIDNGGLSKRRYGKPANVYALFNPESQTKSADPVTYDDNGNVIPLSERFNEKNNDIRWSHKDSDGRTLTDAQAEYFKDSKARDENGNLLVMYHSSPNKFTIFDRTRLGENSGFEYGNTAYGFFVTDYKPFSNRFGKNEMKLYANIKKPITHPFMAHNKYDDAECERITRDWLEVIDPDQFETYEIYKESEPDLTLYEFYMNLWEGEDPFDYAEYDRETLEEAGYDAVEICEGHQNELGKEGEGNDVPVTTYAVFNSNQLKNVTNKKPTDNPDIRLSKKDQELDAQYMDAVKKGDMETAQEMVDEQAKKAGYDVKAYHGTSNFGFTKFSTRDNNGNRIETENGRVFGDGFYFTDNKDVAERRYANVLSRSRLVDGEWVTEKTNRGVYSVYLNLGNNYVLDWNDTKGMSQRDFERLLRDIWKDHNSLTIKNIRDGIDITSTVYVVEMTPENAEQYWDTAWSSSRIKSADPVTYDDNGDVIPLSERFNSKNEDIRYSRKDSDGNTLTEAQAEYFKDSKARDEDGNLLVMYHGSPFEEEFNVFDSRNGSGLKKRGWNWFTPDAKYAEGYSIQYSRPGHTKTGYVNATNPLDIGDINKTGVTSDPYGLRFSNAFKRIAKAVNTTPEELYRLVNEDYGGDENYDALDNLYDDWSSDNVEIPLFAFTKSGAFRELAEKAGYDSVKALEDGAVTYGVAESNQFKNADNEKPTEDKDIRYSLSASFEAIGCDIRLENGMIRAFKADGTEITKFTLNDIRQSPLGRLLTLASNNKNKILSGNDVTKQVRFLADLYNMILKTQDPDLIWAVSGTIGYDPKHALGTTGWIKEAKSKFASITGNADPQYKTTIDFTTICVKTQAIIDAMSKVMMDLGRGLTEHEIIDIVYKETAQAGEQVPCPVCYVFSRWVGLGNLLGKIKEYQQAYPEDMDMTAVRKEYESIKKEVDKLVKESTGKKTSGSKAREQLYKDTISRKDFLDLKDQMPNKKLTKAEQQELEDLNRRLEVLDHWSWLEKTRLADDYKAVPDDVLFDLNAGRAFATDYPATWRFRTTRGPALGKAVAPYSPSRLGDTIRGIASPSTLAKLGNSKRVFLNQDGLTSTARKAYDKAIANAKRQNRMNGQRLQSTSDFRFEYALDYLLSFIELEAIGARAQMYTKVPEAVKFLASMGAEVNCSIMPKGTGLDAKGNLIFSDITGMSWKDAEMLSQMYNNVQPILVAIGREHLIKAMAEKAITMIIPYHASGSSEGRYRAMMEAVGESVKERTDFAKYENEHERADATPEQKLCRTLREDILTGKLEGKELTDKQQSALKNNEILRQLYIRVYGKDINGKPAKPNRRYVENFDENGNDADCLGVYLTKEQAGVMMPYEYWDKNSTIDDADKQGEAYVKYCESLGLTPVFSGWDESGKYDADMDFTSYPGYWKTLIDRCMYNNDGLYHKQQAVNVNNVDLDMLDSEAMKVGITNPMRVQNKEKTETIAKRSEEAIARESQGETRLSKKDADDRIRELIDERKQKADDGEQLSFFGSMNDTLPKPPKQKTPAEMFYDDVLETIAEIKKKGGWTGDEIKHLLDETVYGFGNGADFHFIERLNDKSDDTAVSDFNAFLTLFTNETDLRNYKWYFSQYRIDKYWKTALRSGKTKFTKLIDKRMEEIMAGKVQGRNVGIETRDYTPKEARALFNDLNTDKELKALADKVFDCIDKNFNVVYRGDNNIRGFSHAKGGVTGTSTGRTIDLNMKMFNSEAYTDQMKASNLLHETIHAVTVYAINTYHEVYGGMDAYDLSYDVRMACSKLDEVYSKIKYDPAFKGEYGITNVKEMVAELSNPQFRAKLKAKNLYQRIIDSIKKIFGIETKTAYDAVNEMLEVLLNQADVVSFERYARTQTQISNGRYSLKESDTSAKTIEYQSTIRKLEKETERLKAEFKRTNKKPNIVETKRQAGKLIQRHASNMSIHQDVTDALTNIYEMYAQRGTKAFDDIYEIAERTAVEIVNNISEVHFEGKEEYDQIKEYLRDTEIVITDEMKRNITDFNDFRKRYFGKLKLVNGTTGNIDSVYQELNEMFPTQFTEDYINPADQLNHIADVLDSYAPFYETLDGTSEEMQDYVVEVASDLMETAYNLQNKKTFADKKYDEKVKAVKKAREKALANKKEALSKLRARYSSRMAEAVRDAKSETKAKIDEKAQKKRRIAQIAKTHKRLADKLFTPSDTKHLPDGYDKAVANVLHMFDFTTSRMEKWAETHDEPSKRMQALRDLRKRLESYVRASEDGNKEGVDLGMEVDSDLIEIVDELEGALGENVKLSDLDSTVLEDVATLFRAFEHQINSYNRAFDENNQKRISDLADVVVDEAKAVKHGKWRAGIMGRVFTSNLNPWDFFQMIGGEVGDLYKATRKGFDKYENNLRVAKNFMADLIGSKQYDKWANHTKTYKTTSGEEITLTDTQLMSLYCLSKREQAQGHIYGQGVVSAPVKVKRNMIAKQLDKKRVIPTFDDVVDWTKNLSKEQIEVADKIQNFLSNEVAEWGNETSLKLYGYKKFTEKDYFPIQSSDDYLNSNFDAKGSDPTLKNISPTKAVVKGANNPLMLDDIFSIFSKHVAQMASYNGFVPAITDFQRVWNHKMVSADGRKTTVKETFGEAYGDRIAKYVEQFYADLNGVYKKNLDVTTPEKLFGTFKKSAVGGNLRVLAQQPMAIARAMLLVDPALLTVSVPKTALQAKRTYQEMLEHCPIAEWKVWGFYSPDVMGASRDLKNVMLGKDSISDKVFMNMYGVADNITWTVIFNACKMQVERQNKGIAKGSQEYWDKVNDLASDVYDATQVVDSPFHRSELMKSQDGIHKMATAFMAEPTKTINMINTQLTLCAREISEGKVGKATLRFTRLTGTVLANAMLLAVGQSLIDAMRSAGGGDDDDDKGDFEERFKKHWVTNTKDNLNLLKMLPYVKDAVSIYEGFGVTRMDMNGVEKAVKATQALKKYYDDPGSAKYTELELWNNTAMAFAYTLGVPISNAKRDLDSLALTVAESVKDPKVMLWYMKNKYQVNSKTKSIWADAYYDALDKGNKTLANNIYAYMKKSGVDDKYIQNRKTTWEKHRYGEDSNGTDSED